jgi:hypothetical protein
VKKEEMTSIKELNEDFVPKARLDAIPDMFLGRLTSIESREDRNFPGYDAVYMDIAIEDPAAIAQAEGDAFTQKLRSMHVDQLLIPAMHECGVTDTDDLVGKSYVFEKKKVSFEGSYPRWMPTNGNGKKGKGTGKGKGRRTA